MTTTDVIRRRDVVAAFQQSQVNTYSHPIRLRFGATISTSQASLSRQTKLRSPSMSRSPRYCREFSRGYLRAATRNRSG